MVIQFFELNFAFGDCFYLVEMVIQFFELNFAFGDCFYLVEMVIQYPLRLAPDIFWGFSFDFFGKTPGKIFFRQLLALKLTRGSFAGLEKVLAQNLGIY
jgi:hypothetical protein